MKFTFLLKKIINTSLGKINFWLATVGLGLALLLILAAVQLKYNFESLKGSKTQYLLISKEITNAMMGDISKSSFSDSEIKKLQECNFFDSVQGIKTSLFKVKLDIPLNTIPLNTDMFFESVPDAYLDVMPKGWAWQPGDGDLQGIAPRFLLDMYNYGFAVGQQLPQLSQETIGTIPLNFTISNGDGSKKTVFKGNIGALSNRYMSILVPESFMNWANNNYGYITKKPATRVVVKAKDPTSKAMNSFLSNQGLKTDYGDSRYSKYGFILSLIEKASKVNGVLFFCFAMLVFVLFIQLTIVNAKTELQLLATLGTSPRQLQQFLLKKITPIYIYTIGIILLVLSVAQYLLATNNNLQLSDIYLPYLLPLPVLLTALLLLFILCAVNYYTIKKQMQQIL